MEVRRVVFRSHGQHPGGGDRRADRRHRTRGGGPPDSGGRAVRGLRGDGRGAGVPPGGSVRARPGPQDLRGTMAVAQDRTAAGLTAGFAAVAGLGLLLLPDWMMNLTVVALARGLAGLGLLLLWPTRLGSEERRGGEGGGRTCKARW